MLSTCTVGVAFATSGLSRRAAERNPWSSMLTVEWSFTREMCFFCAFVLFCRCLIVGFDVKVEVEVGGRGAHVGIQWQD